MKRMALVFGVALGMAACDKAGEGPPPLAPGAAPAQVAPAAAAAPTLAPAAAPAGQAAAAPAGGIGGKVLERIDAASYSYLRLATAGGEVWAAVPQADLAVGAEVTVVEPMTMTNFESKTLGRTFPTIYFGNLAGTAGTAPTGMMGGGAAPGAPAGDPHGGAMGAGAMGGANPHGGAAPAEAIKIDKPAGGVAVAELFSRRAELKDTQVVFRGKVVKYNANIMGKNWLHLQDGSGSPDAADHDIAVTSAQAAAVGEVVTVTGKLQLDQDFGAGYVYPLIVQEATLAR